MVHMHACRTQDHGCHQSDKAKPTADTIMVELEPHILTQGSYASTPNVTTQTLCTMQAALFLIRPRFYYIVLSLYHRATPLRWTREHRLRNFVVNALPCAFAPAQARVSLAILALKESNVLLLDEVSNHLDIGTVNVLTEALRRFDGSIVAITHNKAFAQALEPTHLLNVKDGQVSLIPCLGPEQLGDDAFSSNKANG